MRVTLCIVYCSTLRSQLANVQNTLIPCFHFTSSNFTIVHWLCSECSTVANTTCQCRKWEHGFQWIWRTLELLDNVTAPVRAVNTANTIPSSEFSQKLHKTFSNVISLVRLLCCSLLHCGARLLNTRPSLEALMSGGSENKIIKKLRSQGKTYFLYITRLRI